MEPLVVPGTMDSLSSIGQYVLQAAAAAGLDKKRAYRLRLAVDEIATNVVEHGYEETDLDGDLRITAELTADCLTVTLEDTTASFDPRGQDASEATFVSKPLEERPIGHLGILLALQGIDNFDYQTTDSCNRSIFVVRRENAESLETPQP